MKKVLVPLVALGLIAIILYTFTANNPEQAFDEAAWRTEIENFRQEKNSYFRTDAASPLPDSLKESFAGLNYFSPDPAYRLVAKVSRNSPKERISLPTSDNQEKDYYKWGTVAFELHGVPLEAVLLEAAGELPEGEKTLFLPFSDNTSADETYGAGRYLELPFPEAGQLVIDFNKAYNPFCAYNDGFSCPFPPSENQLTVPIRAGEKVFEK